MTYKFKGKSKIKIQAVPGYCSIQGLDQVPAEAEFANAKLVQRASGFYVLVTTFINKTPRKTNNLEIGLDMGVGTAITLSDGRKINASVEEHDRLKRLQRKLGRNYSKNPRNYRSNNRNKLKALLQREYEKLTNKKNDLANKIVHELLQYKDIYMQDENLTSWKVRFGKKVHHSVLGRVKAKLIPHAFVLDRFVPTTKACYNCGQLHEMPLDCRIYTCDCGIEPEDRDIHSAKNMILLAKSGSKLKSVPMGHRDLGSNTKKPVEFGTSATVSSGHRNRKRATKASCLD